MRKNSKFKLFTKTKSFSLSLPKKILKFKHSKWKSINLKLFKLMKRSFFFDYSLVSTKLKKWSKKKLFFKNKLFLKREFYQYFDSSLQFKTLKNFMLYNKYNKKLDNIKYLNSRFITLEYKIDNLLTRLKFFSSVYGTKQAINKQHVLVNSVPVKHNYILKKGDIITFSKKPNQIETLISQLHSFFFIPFAEVDFYTSTIVIIKNPTELSNKDLTLFFVKHFNGFQLSNIAK